MSSGDKYEAKRTIYWDACHSIHSLGKYHNIHGHRFSATFTWEGEHLDGRNLLVEVGRVGEQAEEWIRENWDHAVMLSGEVGDVGNYLREKGYKVFMMDGNPTSEALAEYLGKIPGFESVGNIILRKVEVRESDEIGGAYYPKAWDETR